MAITASEEQRLGALDVVLSACARQGLTFEEAWYISVPVVLHGVDGELAGELRRRLRAGEARIAAEYTRRERIGGTQSV